MAHPSAEDFEQWLDNPVTRWVFEGCRIGAELNRQAWINASWDNGKSDPLELAELKSRADAYLALPDTPFERWCEIIDGDDE